VSRLFILSRHAETTLNLERRINGDPAVRTELTERGAEEAARLGAQVANVDLDVCVHTRFERTRRTAELALAGRGVPFRVEPLLDDIDIGELEGSTIDQYRAWKRAHARSDAFPGGESLDDAGRRYARAFSRLLELPAQSVLVVCHEIPIRYAVNAAAGSSELDGPVHVIANATPYVFGESALGRAATRIEELVRVAGRAA
jgi:broad specificity phosphatase PhoE